MPEYQRVKLWITNASPLPIRNVAGTLYRGATAQPFNRNTT